MDGILEQQRLRLRHTTDFVKSFLQNLTSNSPFRRWFEKADGEFDEEDPQLQLTVPGRHDDVNQTHRFVFEDLHFLPPVIHLILSPSPNLRRRKIL